MEFTDIEKQDMYEGYMCANNKDYHVELLAMLNECGVNEIVGAIEEWGEIKIEEEIEESKKKKETEKVNGKRPLTWTKEDIEKVGEMYKEGLSYAEIGERLGKTAKSVRRTKVRYFKDLKRE